jgi:hypothetical protein
MEYLRPYLHNERFKQWTLVTAAGWAAGLILGGLALGGVVLLTLLIGGMIPFIGLALGGAITGICVGFAQQRLLDLGEFERKRWIGASALGGAAGAYPAILASFLTGVSAFLGFALVGALFGAAIGAAQWWQFRDQFDRTGGQWWLASYALGGLLCAVIAVPPHPLLLPLCCPLGTLVMGAATGVAVVRMLGDGGVEGSDMN